MFCFVCLCVFVCTLCLAVGLLPSYPIQNEIFNSNLVEKHLFESPLLCHCNWNTDHLLAVTHFSQWVMHSDVRGSPMLPLFGRIFVNLLQLFILHFRVLLIRIIRYIYVFHFTVFQKEKLYAAIHPGSYI